MTDSSPPKRRLVVEWEDPLPSALEGSRLAGTDYLRAYASAPMPAPPIAVLLGMELVEVDEGRVVFACIPGEQHYNPMGIVHGGLAATLLDSAMGSAVHSVLAPGVGYTTLQINVNFVRPITAATGRIVCEGTVLHRGGSVATAEGRLRAEADGRLLAHATTTCAILKARAASAR